MVDVVVVVAAVIRHVVAAVLLPYCPQVFLLLLAINQIQKWTQLLYWKKTWSKFKGLLCFISDLINNSTIGNKKTLQTVHDNVFDKKLFILITLNSL